MKIEKIKNRTILFTYYDSPEWDEMIQENKNYLKDELDICLPNVIFEKELYFPEDKIRIIYTPGHTIDSISIVDEKEKIINVGDTVNEIVPSIYGEKDLYIETLLKYKEMDFDTCISGHNVVLGKDVIEKILNKL